MQRNPNNEVAQATPNLWYMAGAKSGKPAPAIDLIKVLTEMALFE